jgi:hypothetical protein
VDTLLPTRVQWREEEKNIHSILLIAADTERVPGSAAVAGAEMVVHDKLLGLLTRDGAGNVRILRYDPIVAKKDLVRSGCVCVCGRVLQVTVCQCVFVYTTRRRGEGLGLQHRLGGSLRHHASASLSDSPLWHCLLAFHSESLAKFQSAVSLITYTPHSQLRFADCHIGTDTSGAPRLLRCRVALPANASGLERARSAVLLPCFDGSVSVVSGLDAAAFRSLSALQVRARLSS